MSDGPHPAPGPDSTPAAAAEPGEDHNPAVAVEPITGNYFVSAYPPFFYWSETEVAAVLATGRETSPAHGPAPAPPLGLYIHIPFCVQRCNYCYYLSYEGRGDAMGPYCDALGRELAAWMTPLPQVLENVEVSDRRPVDEVPEVCQAIEAAELALSGQGRVLVRYSGTQPLARVMIEGQDQEQIRSLADGIAAAIRRTLG